MYSSFFGILRWFGEDQYCACVVRLCFHKTHEIIHCNSLKLVGKHSDAQIRQLVFTALNTRKFYFSDGKFKGLTVTPNGAPMADLEWRKVGKVSCS